MDRKIKQRLLWIVVPVVLVLAGIFAIFMVMQKPQNSEEAATEETGETGGIGDTVEALPEETKDTTETLPEEETVESVLERMRPALVTLQDCENESAATVGSGFILEIGEDKTYICTNRHVIEEYENWEIGFYDGTKIDGGMKAGVSQTYDVGIVTLDTNLIPQQLLQNLLSVDIDLDYWYALQEQTDVGFVSMYQEEEDKYVKGLLLSTLTDFPWGNELRQSEFQMKFEDGDSGSAIFDNSGHLISMVMGTSYGDETGRPRRWGVPLSAIMTCYMEIRAEAEEEQ